MTIFCECLCEGVIWMAENEASLRLGPNAVFLQQKSDSGFGSSLFPTESLVYWIVHNTG